MQALAIQITMDDLPIIAHESIAAVECCGCLMVTEFDSMAVISCNECGVIVRVVPSAEVLGVFAAWLEAC